MLDDMVKKKVQRPVTLIWGGRNRSGLYLMSAVERWKKALLGFAFIAAVEDKDDASALGGFQGRVDDAVRASFTRLEGHEVYCCGSPPMVTAVKKACIERGRRPLISSVMFLCRGLQPEGRRPDLVIPGPTRDPSLSSRAGPGIQEPEVMDPGSGAGMTNAPG